MCDSDRLDRVIQNDYLTGREDPIHQSISEFRSLRLAVAHGRAPDAGGDRLDGVGTIGEGAGTARGRAGIGIGADVRAGQDIAAAIVRDGDIGLSSSKWQGYKYYGFAAQPLQVLQIFAGFR